MTPKKEFEIGINGNWSSNHVNKNSFIYSWEGESYIPNEDIDYAAFFLQCPPYPSSSDKEDEFFHIEWDKDKTQSSTEDTAFLTIFLITRYIGLLKEIIRSGLKKDYVIIEDNLKGKVKGRILHKYNSQKNILTGHKERFYCSFQVYTEDIPVNRLLKSVLEICKQEVYKWKGNIFAPQCTYNLLLSSITNCLSRMDSIGTERNLLNYIRKVRSPHGKLFRNYEQSLEIAEMILKLKERQFYSNGTNTFSLPDFWIYLPTMFEHYVYGKLTHKVDIQPQGQYKQRADFIIKDPPIVIDAKYKYKYQNETIEKGDFRQLSGYARDSKYFGTTETVVPCVIVYPILSNAKKKNSGNGIKHEVLVPFQNEDFLKVEPIDGLIDFYKVGVKIPVKP